MPRQERHKTAYPGVFYVLGQRIDGKTAERIYYISYRKNGKKIEEKAGRQHRDSMTPARANQLRIKRIEGELSNQERRDFERQEAMRESPWTIGRLYEAYMEHRPKGKSYTTDVGRFKNYLAPYLADKEPKDIIPLDVDRVRRRVAKIRTPQTVKHVLILLQRLVNYGAKKGLCPGLSFKIEMPRVDNVRTEFLTPDELQRLLAAMDAEPDPQAANFMRLALFTGMRRGELFKLKWSDLDFDRGFITLRAPKGGKSQKIPMSEAARSVLENHPMDPASDYVFPGKGGGQRVRPPRNIDRIREAAGLPKGFRPLHGLRHTYASLLASSGQVDLYTLQKLMTHKSAAMTQRYAHLRDEALQAAANVASDIMAQAGNKVQPLNTRKENQR